MRCRHLYFDACDKVYRRCQLDKGHKDLHAVDFISGFKTKHFSYKKNDKSGKAITLTGTYHIRWHSKCSYGLVLRDSLVF